MSALTILVWYPYVSLVPDLFILEDPGADKGGEGKSKRAEKYGTKKSKERQEEPLGTMSYQTSSNGRRRSGFWLVPEKHKFSGTRKWMWFIV